MSCAALPNVSSSSTTTGLDDINKVRIGDITSIGYDRMKEREGVWTWIEELACVPLFIGREKRSLFRNSKIVMLTRVIL